MSMPRHSGLHVMACAEIRIWQNQAWRSMPWHAWMQKLAVYNMPQHAMQYAATCGHSMRQCWGMKEGMPRHAGKDPKG